LLLDEVTTALDVVVRQDLLRYLQKETETRGATVVYATHIFDGLDEWPTHIHYLNYHGNTGWQGKLEENEFYTELRNSGHPSPMLKV
jgi:CCR4-NOT complex subunit CAF16